MNTNFHLGYTKPLYILPFDHRGSFAKGLFNLSEGSLSENDTQKVKDAKHIIYEAFQKSLENGVPVENAAILIDEQFGSEIIPDALQKGYMVLLTVEKSGQEVFDFEYGAEFEGHITKYNPPFVKALIRHNPEMEEEKRSQQLSRLRTLSDFAHANNYKFLIEPLIPPTKQQLEHVGGDEGKFDQQVRPQLAINMISQLHAAGVEPDVWKLEGMEKEEDYKMVSEKAREGAGRENVGVVILGRGATQDQVEKWLAAGKNVEGVIGFAVGRTVFWEALVGNRDGKLTREEAIEKISKNFKRCYEVFTS